MKEKNKNEITGISVASNQFHQNIANVRPQHSHELIANDMSTETTMKTRTTANKGPFWGFTKLILNF